jgi:hypothetical protein
MRSGRQFWAIATGSAVAETPRGSRTSIIGIAGEGVVSECVDVPVRL